ncbi:MAG: hypothetical protein JXQ99_11215 [Hyphomicrobiaceae bacterium]
MRTAVLIGLGVTRSFPGCVAIGIHERGVSFRVIPILSMFCKPLFIPFRDISGWDTTWFLNAKSSELHFRRVEEIKMVLPAEDAEWIRGRGGNKMALNSFPPPQGNAGQRWRAVYLTYSFLMIAVVAFALSTGEVTLFQTPR